MKYLSTTKVYLILYFMKKFRKTIFFIQYTKSGIIIQNDFL